MLGNKASPSLQVVNPNKKNLPLFFLVLVVVFFLLTRRRDGDTDVIKTVERTDSVWKVEPMSQSKITAWSALAEAQLEQSFPCTEASKEQYTMKRFSPTLGSSEALWSMMSTEAAKKGEMSILTIDSPCARSGSKNTEVHLRSPSTDVDVYLQVFKLHFLKLLYPLVAEGKLNTKIEYILDGGANCGMTTVLLASLFPSATIVSVEPDPNNFAVLQKNTAHLPNVKLVQAGLWDVTGKIALKGNHGQWGRVFKRVENSDPSGMQAFSVSHILKQFGIPRFDLVKMDIEGSEAVVLGGHGDVSWLEDVQVFFAEVHDMFAGYFGLSEERQEVTEIVERIVSERMKGPVRVMDNEHSLYFAGSVVAQIR